VIGKKADFNFPIPHNKILNALRMAKARGDYVSFCTGRAMFATLNILRLAGLDNPHISDGGSPITNPPTGGGF
jgi:hydroxymethylpyrimidine pyrophosphatase-like HAD family hydrolase